MERAAARQQSIKPGMLSVLLVHDEVGHIHERKRAAQVVSQTHSQGAYDSRGAVST